MVGDLLALEDVGHEHVVDHRGLARQVAASAGGTTPTAACASVASSSTSSHMREAGLVAEERGHVRRGVAGDHEALPVTAASERRGPPQRRGPLGDLSDRAAMSWPSAFRPIRSARRRVGRGAPRPARRPAPVTPSTRPPAVRRLRRLGPTGAGVEHGHALYVGID